MTSAAIAVLAVVAFAVPVHAAPDRLLTVASLGYDGRVRLGAWTPVWIDLVAPPGGVDGMLQIETSGPSGQAGTSFAVPVRATPGALLRVFVPVLFNNARSPGTVRLHDRLGQVASLPLPRLQPMDEIVAVLSAEPLGVEGVAGRLAGLGVAQIEPEALPPVWQAYQAVRLLVVRDLDERRVTDQQRQAILQWVWSGGRLLAMPSGDDVRHLRGPTLGPLLARAGGGVGLGRATVWDHDAALPEHRGRPIQERAWERVLAGDLLPVAPGLEITVPQDRGVLPRTQAAIGMLVLAYVLAARRLSRFLAGLRPVSVVATVLVLAVATGAAVWVAALARSAASGVVASSVIEGLPGTGHGLLAVAARSAYVDGEGAAVVGGRDLLLRPSVPARLRVVHSDETSVEGGARGVLLTGTAIVPLSITGTYAAMPGGAEVTVANRSGHRLETAWVYAAGRAQAIPSVGPAARIALDDRRWQVPGRLQRADPNPALLAWAFARLEAGAILKEEPAWLLGWIRDPAGGLRWGNRPEPPLQLVLVPLSAP
ncbi:MAG: hypothetical protein QME77_00260 [bacterium]|nr:hypothetical protein [bacterium]